jgi:hypothetical protein
MMMMMMMRRMMVKRRRRRRKGEGGELRRRCGGFRLSGIEGSWGRRTGTADATWNLP